MKALCLRGLGAPCEAASWELPLHESATSKGNRSGTRADQLQSLAEGDSWQI